MARARPAPRRSACLPTSRRNELFDELRSWVLGEVRPRSALRDPAGFENGDPGAELLCIRCIVRDDQRGQTELA